MVLFITELLQLVEAECEPASATTQACYQSREKPSVEKLCRSIDSAFDALVLGLRNVKGRARGGSHVDPNSEGNAMTDHRRPRGKKFEDD